MSNSTVYECPECGDRKIADYKQQLPPTLWCSCDGFVVMDVVENSDEESKPDGYTMIEDSNDG